MTVHPCTVTKGFGVVPRPFAALRAVNPASITLLGSSDGGKSKSTFRAKKNKENKAPSFPRTTAWMQEVEQRRSSCRGGNPTSQPAKRKRSGSPPARGRRKRRERPRQLTPARTRDPIAPAGDHIAAGGCAGCGYRRR